MALEAPTNNFFGALTVTNPTATDPKSAGDDHIRLLKKSGQDTFTGFAGMVLIRGTETGSGNAFGFTVSANTAPAAYSTGMLVAFKATHANTGACTFQLDALGTKDIKDVDGNALASGDIASGSDVLLYYDGTDFSLLSGNDKVSRNGDTLIGTYDMSGATITFPSSVALPGNPTTTTQTAGDNSTRIATTAFVAGVAISATLPSQTGKDGMVVTSISGVANFYEGIDQSRMALGVI